MIYSPADALGGKRKKIKSVKAVADQVSAVSSGIINGTPMLDLPYTEDSQAMTDMSIAMTGSSPVVEIQGTVEHRPSVGTGSALLDPGAEKQASAASA